MSRQAVEEWYSKIPTRQRASPLIILNGSAYSPNEVLTEVRANSELGQALQTVIEQRQFTPVLDKYALACTRLMTRLGSLPADTKLMEQQKSYSPSQLMQEIQNGTPVGRRVIEAEVKQVEETLAQSVS